MTDAFQEKLIISPSLISLCDLCNLESSVKKLESFGFPMLHIDILDGYFSPSMPLGLDTVRRLRQLTELPFDVHVMVERPDYFVDELLDIGVQQIVFHAECERHIQHQLDKIHLAGVRAGLALKPATPLNVLDYALGECDCVLLMLINPGFASFRGEKQVPYAAKKVKDLRKMINDRALNTLISLDGRISRENIRELAPYADIFVGGSTCVDRSRMSGSISELQNFCAEVRAEL